VQCDEDVVDCGCDGFDERVCYFREEVSECECVARVTFYACAFAPRRGGEDGTSAIEAQVCPGDEEAEPGKEQCSFRTKDKARDCVGEEEQGREMFNAHTDHPEKVDGVFGHELLEGD